MIHRQEQHCICQMNYQNVDEGSMIQCQNCQTWYNSSCISLPTIPKTVTCKEIHKEREEWQYDRTEPHAAKHRIPGVYNRELSMTEGD